MDIGLIDMQSLGPDLNGASNVHVSKQPSSNTGKYQLQSVLLDGLGPCEKDPDCES